MVIVGNGMVVGRFLDEVLQRDKSAYKITVIGAEPHGSYNRILLSSVLAQEASTDSIVQKDYSWYQENNIRFLAGSPVVEINRREKFVVTEDGTRVDYEQLIIATGSNAARIPADNLDLKNIFTFRNISDTHAVMSRAEGAKQALVVGGGLLGLEAAYGLAKFGIKVTLLHRSGWLLNRQLDEPAAEMLKAVMSSMNIDFILSDEVSTFKGDTELRGVQLKSGLELDIDLAVIATGVIPNSSLGLKAQLDGKRAIEVDDYMQTSDSNISAIGECIEHNGDTFGMVDPLWRQAVSLADRLVIGKQTPFKNQAIATKLKVSGVQVFSAGEVETRKGLRAISISDKKANIYRKLLIDENRIVGIVLFGDVRSGQFYFELMQNNTDVSALLPTLIFGEAYLPAEASATAAA